MRSTVRVRSMRSPWAGWKELNKSESSIGEAEKRMAITEFLAPVPAAADYTVSADLWQRLESEVKAVSARIEAGDELTPEDVVNVRTLKRQVDSYVTDFTKAMKGAEAAYKKMVDQRLIEIGYSNIENFTARKRQEQTASQNVRIAYKMECLKTLSEGLLAKTTRLKEMQMAKELLPAFTARFPNIQSGAKNKDITDWAPYIAIMQRAITIMDSFFCDPKYEDAALLPLHSGTIKELLAFARDGKEEHLTNTIVKYKEDEPLIRMEKLKQGLKTKADGIKHIRQILDNMGDLSELSEGARQIRTEQTWEEISLIVRLTNNQ